MKTSLTRKIKNGIFVFLLASLSVACSENTLEEETFETFDFKIEKATTAEEQLEILTKAMRRYHNIEVALAQGYEKLPVPYISGMGYHYMKFSNLDGEFNLLEPEILVYYPDANGKMVFGAAEYLVPLQNCDEENPSMPAPEGFIGNDDHWHVNCGAGGWTLHAWVGTENPDGVFAANNSMVP